MKQFFLNIWYLFVGAPADLTYWLEGEKVQVRVKEFRDLKPNGISYTNIETGKQVIIRSTKLSFVLKEE
tara:strand:+ start:509 stop:715 length:207 start_codon:yes stop_codon:yes gene_type:complete